MLFLVLYCGYAQGRTKLPECACVGLLCMWLQKYRLFYVAFALCFSVSLVGGWLNESFGQRLRYQKEWFGLGVRGRETREEENQLVLVASGFLMHTTAQ